MKQMQRIEFLSGKLSQRICFLQFWKIKEMRNGIWCDVVSKRYLIELQTELG
jgi:hypothetical protein